jgi:hypothetical protein
MSASSQPIRTKQYPPNYAVEKVTYRGRSDRFLHVWLLWLVVTALSVAMCNGMEPELNLRAECNADESTKLWEITEHTLSRFEVGGVNLALYKQENEVWQTKVSPEASEPFDLYEDFNIADQITGDESWNELTTYRKLLERPSLSFYVDKVARKRWLPTMGYSQPHVFSLKYAHELTKSGDSEEERVAIMDLLPTKADYVAKPTHFSRSDGVWLVKQNTEDGITRFRNTGPTTMDAKEMTAGYASFDSEHLARHISEFLHRKSKMGSWVQENLNAGMVIEELFTDVTNENAPPLEFCMFTIWGKVWLAQPKQANRINLGFFHRDGTKFFESQPGSVPDWLDFSELVKIAEDLGANKDMFRTDIFVGVPAGVLRAGATTEERIAAVQIAVNECEIHPETYVDDEIREEGARLWIAGYKMGNYRVVPNTEVPPSFLETGSFALPAGDA